MRKTAGTGAPAVSLSLRRFIWSSGRFISNSSHSSLKRSVFENGRGMENDSFVFLNPVNVLHTLVGMEKRLLKGGDSVSNLGKEVYIYVSAVQ